MTSPTYTVLRSYATRSGGWLNELRGISAPIPSDTELPQGAAVRIVNGRAVR